MLNPETFKAPFLSKERIWQEADKLRATIPACAQLPIPVLDVVEFDLGLELRPVSGLRQAGDIEALLLGDLKSIVVDNDSFLDSRAQNRLRFSVSHEIGHLILHRDIFGQIQHQTVKDWIDFMLRIPEQEYTWIEHHAYEFAGRFLVPIDRLKSSFEKAVAVGEKAGFTKWDETGETALEFLADCIAPEFGVSGVVIAKRLRKEGLWPLKTTK